MGNTLQFYYQDMNSKRMKREDEDSLVKLEEEIFHSGELLTT